MSEPLVLVEKPQPHTTVVTLNRPERLNAMSIDLVIELDEALNAVADDNDTRVVVLTGAGRAFCSGLDLKDYGIIPNIDGLQVGRIAQRSMRYYSRLILDDAAHAAAGDRRGQRSRVRRRDVPVARRRDAHRVASRPTFNATGIVNGLTSTELGASWLLPAARRRRALQRHAAHRSARSTPTRRCAWGWCRGCSPTTTLMPTALEIAARMCEFSPYGLAMTKDIIWVNLENPSLEAAIEIEDRNQLMLGFTENLPEAIRAFDQKPRPVYTDEPRRTPRADRVVRRCLERARSRN